MVPVLLAPPPCAIADEAEPPSNASIPATTKEHFMTALRNRAARGKS
jgi:hypothetical protein